MVRRLIAYTSECPVRALSIALALFLAIGSLLGAFIGIVANAQNGLEAGAFAGIAIGGSLFGALLGHTIARAGQKPTTARALLGSATWAIAILVWLLILEEFRRVLE